MTEPIPIPVACTLERASADRQRLRWVDLQPWADSADVLADGARLRFPASLAQRVTNLTDREAQCCAFLRLTSSIEGDVLTLEIRSDQAEALPVIDHLAGIVRHP